MKKISVILAATFIFTSLLAGCTTKSGTKQQNVTTNPTTQSSTSQVNTAQSTDKKELSWKSTLYFSDTDAMYIIREEREVKTPADSQGKAEIPAKARTIVEEMIKGPKAKDLSPSIPGSTKVRSVVLEKDTIILDLSKEYIDATPGGSSGEIMAIAPLVAALTELEGVKQVSFKIEGQPRVDFKGHMTLDKPFKRADFEPYIKK